MKKRLLQRIFSLALCATMVAGTVTGCGDSKEQTQKQEQEQTQKQEQEQTQKQEQEESSVKKAFAPFEETVVVKCVGAYTETAESSLKPSTCAWNEILKKYLNIELEWIWEVDNSQYATKLATSLASGDYPDILQVDALTYYELLEADALKDLSAVWEEYASEPLKAAYALLNNEPLENVTVDGKLMAIPYALDNLTTMCANFYRMDWLDNVGMEMPTNLDELTAVIKAFRDQDPDGNGEKDTYAIAADDTLNGLMSFFYTFGSYPFHWIEKGGKIVNGTIQDETKEALDWLRGLYADGYIDPEFATLSAEQTNADVASGKAGIVTGGWHMPDNTYMKEALRTSDEAYWGVGAVVGKNSGEAGKSIISENTTNSYSIVLTSASDEDAIAMIKMLNMFYDTFFHTEDGSDWTWYGTEHQEGDDDWYSWWLPVYLWNPAATYNEHLALSEAMKTGKWNPNYGIQETGTWSTWPQWSECLEKNLSEMGGDKDKESLWLMVRTGIIAARASVEGWPACSVEVLHDAKEAGNYVYHVNYGAETETGIGSAAILQDYVMQYFSRYIMGIETEDSWEQFVNGWLEMGGQKWTEEVNEGYDAIH